MTFKCESEFERRMVDLGLTADRVTPSKLDSLIVDINFHVFENSCVTICQITLENKFNVIGESACAHPDNFNAVIGRQEAFKNAREKIWVLEGYLLKQKLFEKGEI